jgi:hypothetical protein
MQEKAMETADVVANLFTQMEATVSAYGPAAIKLTKRIEGTAFFPGGIGLWQTLKPRGTAPLLFPGAPIMVLGHNFDKVSGFEASRRNGIEPMERGTWLILRRYLQAARVDETDCFFTNVFVGLQPFKAIGEMKAGDLYEEQCRKFLANQIEIVKPRLVATLGKPATTQYALSGIKVPSVSLNHPSYACMKGPGTKECSEIVVSEGAKLRKALDDLMVGR